MENHTGAVTKSHKKIADYVRQNIEKVFLSSISELAESCNVGDATISRFCRQFGFKGFQDFKLALMQSSYKLKEGKNNGGPLPENNANERLFASYTKALRQTFNAVDMESVNKAVDYLSAANKIVFYGTGTSFNAALEGYGKFIRGITNVCINLDNQMQLISAAMLNPGDLAFVISYSGSTKETIEIAKSAKNKGATVICLTHFQKSPIIKYVDCILLCGCEDRLLRGHSLVAQVSEMYIMDLVYDVYAEKNRSEIQANEAAASRILIEKVY